jgi:hypothetical protein
MSTEEKQVKRYHIICKVCGEDIGEDRMYWAEEHLKKYPSHLDYTDKKIV